MQSPAQNHLEFFEQAQQSGFSEDQLRRLRNAYLFAMRLYASRYTGGGKPTIVHEIGTASLALRYGCSFDTVLASLVHGAYWVGDWGRYRRGATRATRAQLREVVGDRPERIVYGFYRLPWSTADVAALAQSSVPFEGDRREAIVVKLLDLLELVHDLGALLFFRDVDRARAEMSARRADIHRVAEIIGPPQLAVDLDAAFERALSADLPPLLVGLGPTNAGLEFLPPSCRTRLGLRLYWGVADAIRGMMRR